MSFEPRDYLRHIRVEVEYLQGSCAGLSLEEFMADETLRRAVVRSLEVSDHRQSRWLGFVNRSKRYSEKILGPPSGGQSSENKPS
jgi:hypothetical protein